MQYSSRLEPADVMDGDVDVEEVSRKRARSEARKRFRIVTSTIVACGRFRVVLEVDAEKREQAESEIIATLGNLGLQPLPEELVEASCTRDQRIYTTHQGAEGSLFIPNQAYSVMEPERNGFCEQAEREVTTRPNATNYESLSIPKFTTRLEETQFDEQAEGAMITMLCGSECETFHIPNKSCCPLGENSGQQEQTEGVMVTPPSATDESSSVPNMVNPTSEHEDTLAREQEVWKFSKHPYLPVENFRNSRLEERGGNESSGLLLPDSEPIGSLRNMDGNTQYWATLASELNHEITKKIQDLESGSGRAKVQKLFKHAEEITKRIGTIESASQANKYQKMQPKATSNTSPTIRAVAQYLSEVFDKLKRHFDELTSIHGRPKQVGSLTAMGKLIEDGRKALSTLERGTNWMADKVTMLQKDLKLSELTVDRHFQKCAEIIPALVNSFLNERSDFDEFLSVFDSAQLNDLPF